MVLLCDADLAGPADRLAAWSTRWSAATATSRSPCSPATCRRRLRAGPGHAPVGSSPRRPGSSRWRRSPASGRCAWRRCARSSRSPSGFGMETAMTIDAHRAGYRLVEVELDLEHRATGRTRRRLRPPGAAARGHPARLCFRADDPRDRPGHHGLHRNRLRRGGRGGGSRLLASSSSTSREPGWVEHDANEIWETTRGVGHLALADADIDGRDLKGIGITNQRETVVAWDPDDRPAAAPGAGLAGPPDRRALRRAPRRPATRRSSGRRPAWCSIPTSRGRRSSG